MQQSVLYWLLSVGSKQVGDVGDGDHFGWFAVLINYEEAVYVVVNELLHACGKAIIWSDSDKRLLCALPEFLQGQRQGVRVGRCILEITHACHSQRERLKQKDGMESKNSKRTDASKEAALIVYYGCS